MGLGMCVLGASVLPASYGVFLLSRRFFGFTSYEKPEGFGPIMKYVFSGLGCLVGMLPLGLILWTIFAVIFG